MPVNLNEEELKKAAARISNAFKKIQDRMIKDAMFGDKLPYSPFVSTAKMAPSITGRPLTFRGFTPLFGVITNPYVVEKKTRSREKKRGFWQRLWDGLTNLNPWPYSPIEFYEVDVPAVIVDRRRNLIICHPSLEMEAKKAVGEGKL